MTEQPFLSLLFFSGQLLEHSVLGPPKQVLPPHLQQVPNQIPNLSSTAARNTSSDNPLRNHFSVAERAGCMLNARATKKTCSQEVTGMIRRSEKNGERETI